MTNSYQDQFEKIWKVLDEISESNRAGAKKRKEELLEERRELARERCELAKERFELAKERKKLAKERRKSAKERRRQATGFYERKPVSDEELARLAKRKEKARKKEKKARASLRKTFKETREIFFKNGFYWIDIAIADGVTAPSIECILRSHFYVVEFFPERNRTVGDESFEIDLIGLAEDYMRQVYIVEVKARFGDRQYGQVLRNLDRFFLFYPEFEGYELYGMIAAPHLKKRDRKWALRHGIYPISITDDLYKLKVPDAFVATSYGAYPASLTYC